MNTSVPIVPRRAAADISSALRKLPGIRSGNTLVFLASLAAVLFAAVLPSAAQGPGQVDQSFNPNIAGTPPTEYVRAVISQPDGKIIIGGKFATIQTVARANIARLNTDGTLDTTFNAGTSVSTGDAVYSLLLQADGKLVIGGHFTSVKASGTTVQTPRFNLARLNADGSMDTGFNPGPNNTVTSMAVQQDGKIIVGGYFETLKPPGEPVALQFRFLARLSPAGIPDPEFTYNPEDYIYSVAIQDDQKILIGGKFLNSDRQLVARINPDTSLDDTFDPELGTEVGLDGSVNCIAVQPDGSILLGGTFSGLWQPGSATFTFRRRLLRLYANGLLDTSFYPNPNGSVDCLAVQADHRIVLGGAFTTLQPNAVGTAQARPGLARINAGGSLDFTFNPRPDDDVTSITVQSDGLVLVGGIFTKFLTTVPRKFFARLHNSEVSQSLSAPSPNQILWRRGGALQEVSQVTFDLSTNNGTDWTPLGAGTRVTTSADWQVDIVDPLPANFLIRARARTGSGNRGSGIIESILHPEQTPLQEWNTEWFGSPESTGNAAPDADPNGNGIPNLLEYALGGDPVGETIGVGILPVLSGDPVTGILKLTFTRDPARDDITLIIQAADDIFGPWEDAAQSTGGAAFELVVPEYFVEEVAADTKFTITFTDKPLEAGLPRRWLRLKITGPQ